MREDQEVQLDDLAEKLGDAFLDEADPAQWAGAGVPVQDRTSEQRGNRQWEIKNANQLGLLFARALELRERLRIARTGGTQLVGDATQQPGDAEAEIRRYEKEATAMLERVSRRKMV